MAELMEVRLREHGRTMVEGLTEDDVGALVGSPARIDATRMPAGRWQLAAGSVVGSFVVRRLHVIIEPKVSIRSLTYLLCAKTGGFGITSWTKAKSIDQMLSIMRHVYARSLGDALRLGPVHAYEERRESLAAPRGRLDFSALLLRHHGVFPPLDCTFDEFTSDVEPNQRLLAAALLLAKSDGGRSGDSQRLLALVRELDDVSERRFDPRTLAPLPYDRRFEHYGSAPTIANMVLTSCSFALAMGSTATLGFLVDMNELYEDFIALGLTRRFRTSAFSMTRQPPRQFLDKDRAIRIEPDLVVWDQRKRALVIGDVKYKVTTEPKREDIFQMHSYCSAMNAAAGFLIYVGVAEGIRRLIGGPTIHLFGFDPDGEPEDLEERLSALAARIESLSRETSAANDRAS